MQNAEFAYEISLENDLNNGTICVEARPQNLEAFELLEKAFKKSESIIDKYPIPEMSVTFEIYEAFSFRETWFIFLSVASKCAFESIEYDRSSKAFRKLVRTIREDTRERKDMISSVIRKCIASYC